MVWRPAQRAAGLIWRLMEGDPCPAALPMRVQKIPFRACTQRSSILPRALPQTQGVDPCLLRKFTEDAAADRNENLHSMTVLRHGKVIAAYSFAPYDREIWHATHSLCKTVTALAVGAAIDDGLLRLDEKMPDIFPALCTVSTRRRYGYLTVFHLLTMTSGALFAEPQSVTERDWVRGFLNSPQLFPVGEKFHYNSMNSYMLAAAVCAKTGKTLSAYLREKLFDAMGIRQFYWETCPMQIEKGGWGLYLLQEDAAKIGQLILNRGAWNGAQLISKAYVEDMCRWHSDPPREMSTHGYGYQCWLWEREGAVRMSGLFGQNVLVVPDLDMVIAVNAGAGKMLGETAFLHRCAKFLQSVQLNSLVKQTNFTESAMHTNREIPQVRHTPGALRRERSYRIVQGHARLLPVFMQLLENAYTTGMQRITFLRKGVKLYIEFFEGQTCNLLEVGFSQAALGEITVNGEVHMVSVRGRWNRTVGRPILQLEIAFLEQASTRYMEFVFQPDGVLHLKLWEKPGKEALLNGAGILMRGQKQEKLLLNRRFLARIESLAEPELIGVLE